MSYEHYAMISMPPTTSSETHGNTPCEVLSVLSGGDDQWTAYRGTRFGAWLRRNTGIEHGWCLQRDAEWLAEEARLRGARVIISEAQVIPIAAAAKMAAALPDVKIVHLLHGVPAWCASSGPGQTYGEIRQSRELTNVYVGTVSDPSAMAWLPGSKIVHLPNPIEVPGEMHLRAPLKRPLSDQPLCVSLIARPSPVKNWGGMLAALGILAQRRPVRALIGGRDNTPFHKEHLAYLNDLEIESELIPFGDWSLTLSRVADCVHVGLAVGYSDALNLIAAEHCLAGIPVVGSPALDWLPKSWIASPQDPIAMANIVERHARSHTAGRLGRQLVSEMAAKNANTLSMNLHTLLI